MYEMVWWVRGKSPIKYSVVPYLFDTIVITKLQPNVRNLFCDFKWKIGKLKPSISQCELWCISHWMWLNRGGDGGDWRVIWRVCSVSFWLSDMKRMWICGCDMMDIVCIEWWFLHVVHSMIQRDCFFLSLSLSLSYIYFARFKSIYFVSIVFHWILCSFVINRNTLNWRTLCASRCRWHNNI